MAIIAPRKPYRSAEKDVSLIVASINRYLEEKNLVFALDLIEQIVDEHPEVALQICAMAYDIYKSMPDCRYEIYQARRYDFNIKPSDRVLDIGSGHIPFPFATDLADAALTDNDYGRAGAAFKMLEGRRVYECYVEDMPFEDKAFDFVYCSHVLEHSLDPEAACKELMRVGKRGYIETPTRGKDTFLCFGEISNHRWALDAFNGTLNFYEYSKEDLKGLSLGILGDMHCNPQTTREKAFSALINLKAHQLNTMLFWEDTFDYCIHKLDKQEPTT
ncbi:MAG: class I SAM-dependent methyltransferase [Bdellovibrionota bacterium]|jgi:hypothetical protein